MLRDHDNDPRYIVTVFYSVSKPNDIDIVDEGSFEAEAESNVVAVLADLAQTIRYHTDSDSLDFVDDFAGRLMTCWVRNPDDIDTDISYTYMLTVERSGQRDGRYYKTTRELPLTMWRLRMVDEFGGKKS